MVVDSTFIAPEESQDPDDRCELTSWTTLSSCCELEKQHSGVGGGFPQETTFTHNSSDFDSRLVSVRPRHWCWDATDTLSYLPFNQHVHPQPYTVQHFHNKCSAGCTEIQLHGSTYRLCTIVDKCGGSVLYTNTFNMNLFMIINSKCIFLGDEKWKYISLYILSLLLLCYRFCCACSRENGYFLPLTRLAINDFN